MEKMKLFVLSLLAALAGVLGLTLVQQGADRMDEVWYHLLTHLFALIGSAGFIGFIFEFLFRRDAIEQFARLFDGDPRFAAALSQDARRRSVANTLRAQLGPEIGEALYEGIVSRYLVADSPYKKQFVYEAVLDDLAADVELAPGIVLSARDYYRLTMTMRFQRPFRYTSTMLIGCILTDDFAELNHWFRQENCIFRDTLVLTASDRQTVKGHWGRTAAADLARAVAPILTLEKLTIDDIPLEIASAAMAPSGNSAGLTLKVPRSLKQSAQDSPLAWYEMAVSGLIDKKARKYPVILSEPTEDPVITLRYPAAGIQHVMAAPFFTGQEPFKPTIVHAKDQVTVSFPRIQEKHAWVFPNSGTIFLWDDRLHEPAPRPAG